MNPNEKQSDKTESTPQSVQPIVGPSSSQPKKKSHVLLITGASILLLVIIGMLVALAVINTKENDTPPVSDTIAKDNTSNPTDEQEKTVVKTAATDNDMFEIVVYEPRQTRHNTTIEYGLKNTCTDCTSDTYISVYDLVSSYLTNVNDAYLLDVATGLQYQPIQEKDGGVLSTENCSGQVAPNESKDCFIAFTKVPANTTVSLVLGDIKIDDILIQ